MEHVCTENVNVLTVFKAKTVGIEHVQIIALIMDIVMMAFANVISIMWGNYAIKWPATRNVIITENVKIMEHAFVI